MYSFPSGLRQTPPPIGTSGKFGLGVSSLRGRRSPSRGSGAGGSCGAVIMGRLCATGGAVSSADARNFSLALAPEVA